MCATINYYKLMMWLLISLSVSFKGSFLEYPVYRYHRLLLQGRHSLFKKNGRRKQKRCSNLVRADTVRRPPSSPLTETPCADSSSSKVLKVQSLFRLLSILHSQLENSNGSPTVLSSDNKRQIIASWSQPNMSRSFQDMPEGYISFTTISPPHHICPF